MHRFTRVLLAALVALPVVLAASSAGAAVGTSCAKASGSATFSPALPKIGSTSKVTTTVTIKGTLGGCTGGGVTSAALVANIKFTIPSNCSSLLAGAATGARGTETLTWNTKQKSAATLVLYGVTGKPTETTAFGPVTSGPFAGLEQTGTLAYTLPTGACASTGLSKVTFTQAGSQTFKTVPGTLCTTQKGTAVVTPGLVTGTKTAQKVAATITIGGCIGGGVTSGSAKVTVSLGPSDCTSLAKLGVKSSMTETVTWNTKSTSTMSGGYTTGPLVGQATVALKITKGTFAGLHASTALQLTPAAGQNCTTAHPIKNLSITGPAPFVIQP